MSFQKPALSDGTFAILHYAGKIHYHIAAFIDKNQDSVSQDVISLFYLDCQSDFVRNLFEKDQLDLTASSKSGSKRHANLSVAAKFRVSGTSSEECPVALESEPLSKKFSPFFLLLCTELTQRADGHAGRLQPPVHSLLEAQCCEIWSHVHA